MQPLQQVVAAGESYLVERIVGYAGRFGYTRFTPADPRVWQQAVGGLSAGLIAALDASTEVPDLSPEMPASADCITAFGIDQARRHRNRGVALEMFLGLMKYFRQSYQDLVDEAAFPADYSRWAHVYVARYFDRIELGFIAEWERSADALNARHEQLLLDRNTELAEANYRLKQEVAERQRAETRVRKLNADLERRVAARTRQLLRINDQNNYRIRELALLNRFSSVNLSEIRLNRFAHLLLSLLAVPPFFDRAMLFLYNDNSETLQGMLGITADPQQAPPLPEAYEPDLSDEALAREFNSDLSRRLRATRIELTRGKGLFQRVVAERRVVRSQEPLAGQSGLDSAEFPLTGAGAAMPLLAKGRLFGVVVVDTPESGRAIGRNDLKFLQLFANQAGIALENLLLFSSLAETNQQLNEAHDQLIHGERLATIGEMAAGIAHELKGPMVAIGGFARRLAATIPATAGERLYVDTIIAEEQRLEAMLDDVLSFSKKTTLCYDNCAIVDAIEGALAIVRHLCEKNRVEVIRVFPKKPVMLYGDCQQLKQVFINLFYNALEVMPNGGTLKVTAAITRRGGENQLAVKVADTGGGIARKVQNSIFSPFFTTKKNGTGLGLPIASRIVNNHHGSIKVRNHAGGGAEFTVLLPVKE